MATSIEEVSSSLAGLGNAGVWHRRPQLRTALPLNSSYEVMSGRNVGLSGLGFSNAVKSAMNVVRAATDAKRAGVNLTPETAQLIMSSTQGTVAQRTQQAADIIKAVTTQATGGKVPAPPQTVKTPPPNMTPGVTGPSVQVPTLGPNATPPPPPINVPLQPPPASAAPAPYVPYTPPEPTYQAPAPQQMFAPVPTSADSGLPFMPSGTAPASSSGLPMPLIIGGGVGLLALVGIVLVSKGKKSEAAQ